MDIKKTSRSIIGIALILLAALLTSLGQFLWKYATLTNGKLKPIFMVLGFLLFIVNGFVVVVSYRFGELSVLQPILCVGFIFSLLLGKMVFNEIHSIYKYCGIFSVLVGVIILARSSKE